MKHIIQWQIALLSVIVFLPNITKAQTDSSTTTNKLIASVSYQTNLHFFGRTDSLQSSGMFPSIGFELKNGFYANGNFIFFRNAITPLTYTGTTIEAGYRFKETKHFNGNVFYSQILYKDQSVLVQSALKSQTGINVAYTNSFVNINVGADLKFSNKTDVGATGGFDHLFIYNKGMNNMAIAINPSFYIYAGTQNFSDVIGKNRNIVGVPITEEKTKQSTRFNILAYEVSMPIVFVAGKFNASISPSYVMPQNLITVKNNASLSERGSNMFYATFSLGLRL
ncbi:MAG: hypothetical protein ACOVNY_13355 [Chitinophagaceae bacterium]|jgi:hypothetical protein